MEAKERLLPCDGCHLCCKGDLILIHPELGDDATTYKTRMIRPGVIVLEHKKNRDCIYLDMDSETGCTIYERRPGICREFSCVDFIKKFNKTELRELREKGMIGKKVIQRGKELRRKNEQNASS